MAAVLYDLCIVGAGMIGTAAARHASLRSEVQVCLIGAAEPEVKTMDRDIYGAHYDEGRIARSSHYHPIWAKLCTNAIPRFRRLEEESGVKFFTGCGNLIAGTDTASFIEDVKNVSRDQALDHQILSEEEAQTLFPYLKFQRGTKYIYQPDCTGHISPRRMVQAQKAIALKQGCDIIDDVVCNVSRCVDTSGNYFMIVTTETGRKIRCKSVLLATGAFTTFRPLLPGLQLDYELDPATVALVEVSKAMAERLRNMPCVRFDGEGHPDWYKDDVTSHNGNQTYYMLPPIQYPDGRYFIKLGIYHAIEKPIPCTSLEDAKRWFVKGNPETADITKRLLVSLFKDLEIQSWRSDFCIIVVTPTSLPYIDKVHAQLGVAVGGNGLGAMSGDELGRLAADMMFGEWSSDIPKDNFKLKYKPAQKSNL